MSKSFMFIIFSVTVTFLAQTLLASFTVANNYGKVIQNDSSTSDDSRFSNITALLIITVVFMLNHRGNYLKV